MTRKHPTNHEDLFPLTGTPTDDIERDLAKRYSGYIAGVDEAGRGPLAGPVVTAAVILDPQAIPTGLDDSKKLSAAKRLALYQTILDAALSVSVAAASPQTIDLMNIRAATLDAMARSVAALSMPAVFTLIDGRDVPTRLPTPGQALVKGDSRSVSIAAASIIAKVTRDRMMEQLDNACPGYGFSRHMGYGTKIHLEALNRLGPSPYHRFSFAPVARAKDRAAR